MFARMSLGICTLATLVYLLFGNSAVVESDQRFEARNTVGADFPNVSDVLRSIQNQEAFAYLDKPRELSKRNLQQTRWNQAVIPARTSI